MGCFVPGQVFQFLREGCIALACAKGVNHLVIIIPGAVRCVGTFFRVCIVNAEHLIMVTGFVILIAYVNAFGIDEVFVFIKTGEIVKSEVAGILHSRRGKRIRRIGDDISAARISFADDQIGNSREAVIAGISNPEDRIHTVIGQFPQLHGIAGIQDNNDLLEACLFDEIQSIDLFLMQCQLTDGRTFLPVALQAVVEVAFFSAEAAHDIDGGIIIGSKTAFRAGIG